MADGDTWELWHQDLFDRECAPSVEVRGEGLVEGLMELWARFLQEGIDGFSHFTLSYKDHPRIDIRGGKDGLRALRGWVFRGESPDASVLRTLAAAHAKLVLSGRTSEPLVREALSAPDCSDFVLALSTLE
jgi:hypothetical protein